MRLATRPEKKEERKGGAKGKRPLRVLDAPIPPIISLKKKKKGEEGGGGGKRESTTPACRTARFRTLVSLSVRKEGKKKKRGGEKRKGGRDGR